LLNSIANPLQAGIFFRYGTYLLYSGFEAAIVLPFPYFGDEVKTLLPPIRCPRLFWFSLPSPLAVAAAYFPCSISAMNYGGHFLTHSIGGFFLFSAPSGSAGRQHLDFFFLRRSLTREVFPYQFSV